MKFLHPLSLFAALAVSFSGAALAETDYVAGYLGYFDVTQDDNSATQFGIEYRGKPLEHGLRPIVGLNATSDSSAYVYVGMNWDVPLVDKQIYLIPNFAVGAYKRGDGKRLGGALEFRSGLELGYQFPNQQRLGIAFNHVSNAGIYDHNPGAETALVSYSIPLGGKW